MLLTGDVDESAATELKKRFRELDRTVIRDVALDFSGVTHIGSAGIGKILLFYKEMAVRGGALRLENVTPEVCRLFRELKLDSILSVHPIGEA